MDEKWFKQRQKEAGVTAEDIAQKLGRNRSAVSHIYSGQRRMSLEWAQAFSDVLDVSVDEVLKRAGVYEPQVAQQLKPGFAESDATPFIGKASQIEAMTRIAAQMGGGRPGIDIWTVKSDALCLSGYLEGDMILVDTHQSERCKAGDTVIAQVYNRQTGGAETILRRFEPPVLVAANANPNQQRVHVVDGNNVAIRGKVIAQWRAA